MTPSVPAPRPHSELRFALALVHAVLLALSTSGCRDDDRPQSAPPTTAPPTAAGGTASVAPVDYTGVELGELYGERLPPKPAWLAENIRRLDPQVDGWPTEVLHDLAAASLGPFFEALAEGDVARMRALCAEDFEGLEPFVPAAPSVDLDDRGWRVRRATQPASEPSGARAADALGELGAELVAPFAQGSLAVSHKITGVDDAGGGRFTTRVLTTLAGRDAEHRPLQQNLTLDVSWIALDDTADGASRSPSGDAGADDGSAEPGARARIVALALRDWSDARLPARPLVDVTRAALGHVPGFESELQRGIESYQMAWDRIFGLEYLGMHGIAVGDLDGDGLEDLYVCQLGGVPNRFYKRQLDGTFVDASDAAGLDLLDNTRSALIVDLDDDGHRDLALAIDHYVLICYSAGDGTFPRDEEHRVWLACPTPEGIYSLSAADPDGDGDLDLYATRYVAGGVAGGYPSPYYDAQNGATNRFFRNAGLRKWSDATDAVGLGHNNDRFSLAAVWDDFDDDGDVDLYVTNDFGRNNLYLNDGRGSFTDVADEVGAGDMASGMGATVADYDLDGDLDIYVSNMFSAPGLRIASQQERYMDGRSPAVHGHLEFHARGNTLLANRGDGTFEDVTEASGAALGYWAWGALFFDLQNDGFEDLYVPNGFVTNPADTEDLGSFFWRRVTSLTPTDDDPTEDYRNAWKSISYMVQFQRKSWNAREPNCVYLNTGDGRFVDISQASGVGYADDGRAVAAFDWNDDGRQDLLLRSRTSPRLRLLENRVPDAGHFLSLTLEQEGPNRDAIGARIFVEAGGRTYRRSIRAGEGYLAQSSLRAHFGLGAAERVERVRVVWPDGEEQVHGDLAVDRHLTLRRHAEPVPRTPLVASPTGAPPLAASDLEPLHSPARRLVLGYKLPVGPLRIPGFAAPERQVADLAGGVVLLHLWKPASEASQLELRELASRRSALAAAGLSVVPLCVADGGPELAEARKLTRELGFADVAGYADGALLRELEALFLEVLGNFDGVPLPASLLLDRAGQIVALYLGPAGIDQLLADTAVVGEMATHFGFNGRLLGGYWELRRSRTFGMLGGVFEKLGRPELAQLYRSLKPQAPPLEDEGGDADADGGDGDPGATED